MCDWNLDEVIVPNPKPMKDEQRWYVHMLNCDECRRTWVRIRQEDVLASLAELRQ